MLHNTKQSKHTKNAKLGASPSSQFFAKFVECFFSVNIKLALFYSLRHFTWEFHYNRLQRKNTPLSMQILSFLK
jgi:hypothetical protein